ncbi:MAG: hypothetical protein P8Z33_14435, partial [Gammaproteobacteria bacterium]
EKSTATIDDGNVAIGSFDANVMVLTLENVNLFAGVGGSLNANGAGLADDTVNKDNGIGFYVEGVSLKLVTVQNTADLTKKYTGLELSLSEAGLVGIPDLTLKVSGAVQVNKGPVGLDRLNWTQVTGTGNELESVDLNMTAALELAVTGTMTLDAFGFVVATGTLTLEKSTATIDDGNVAIGSFDANVMVLTLENVNLFAGVGGSLEVDVFVGVGPYFVDSDNDLISDSTDSNAAGLVLEKVNLAVALFKPTNTGDGSNYYALRAEASTISILGLDLGGSESFTLSASKYVLEVNSGKDGTTQAASAVDFSKLAGGTYTVDTGLNSSVEFNYNSNLTRVSIENALLTIGDYVYVNGGFSFTKQDSLEVQLNDSAKTKTYVDVLAFGAGNLDLFVGSGPYFEDTNGDNVIDYNDARNSDAVGLAVENVNFGLIIMKSQTNPAYKYISLKATADYVGLVGIDLLTISARGISVEYNGVSKTNTSYKTVVDFNAMNYTLDTGAGELVFTAGNNLLKATIEEVDLQISDYIFVHGSLAFERGDGLTNIKLSDGATTLGTEANPVSTINIGASGLTMFVGINGPYWNDLDGDEQIDSDELNDDAVGLAITNANLAMTLFKAQNSTTKYIAVKASADQLGFVGTDIFSLEASTVVVELNMASGTGVDSTTPVIPDYRHKPQKPGK